MPEGDALTAPLPAGVSLYKPSGRPPVVVVVTRRGSPAHTEDRGTTHER
jgi:hypothetical protein